MCGETIKLMLSSEVIQAIQKIIPLVKAECERLYELDGIGGIDDIEEYCPGWKAQELKACEQFLTLFQAIENPRSSTWE